MTGPMYKTFGVLSSSASPEAMNLLIAALESSLESISLAAAGALLDRDGTQGQREILTRFPQLLPAVQQSLQARAERFDAQLRQLLVQGSSEQRKEGIEAVRRLHAVDQIPQLIQLLCRNDLPDLDSVAACLADLVNLVEEEVRQTSVTDASRNIVMSRRDRALAHLDQAISQRYESLVVKDPVIEGVLILGPATHNTVKKVLWQAAADCRERAGRMLMTSTHPKVMRQVLETLRQSYPHPKAFEAVATRTDIEFLCELISAAYAKSSGTLEKNLKQIEHLAWLEGPNPPFDLIPQALQPALLSLVYCTKVAPEFKSLTQDWLLRHGGPAGRMAAADKAALVDEDVIQDVLVESLDAADENVQAWAVTQLREHAVPATFGLLLERLESPSPEVRDAVRAELSDFNLERVLGLLDELDQSAALRVGELLRKIDETALRKLQHDLQHAVRPKRIRAAMSVVKLGYQQDLLQPLLDLAADQDFLIRRTMAELLGTVLEPEVLPVLERLSQDLHPRVRDAALRAVTHWHQQSAELLSSV